MRGTMEVIQIHNIIVAVNRRSYQKIQLACHVYIASHQVAVRNQWQIQVPLLALFTEIIYRGYPAERALSAMRKHGG